MLKKINWITPDSFIDVDLPIINSLQGFYKINWQIVISHNNNIDYETYVYDTISNNGNLKVSFYYLKHRTRDPRNIIDYVTIINRAKKDAPSLYYLSLMAMPYGIWIYRFLLPINKCVVACHNVSTPKGASLESFTRRYIDWWLSTFKNIQVFSKSQKGVLENKYKNKNILLAPLAIKNYGTPNMDIDKSKLDFIRFLNFGIIVGYKRIDLLIKAGNLLYERGVRNFRICIAGKCNTWQTEYAPLIKYPEIFELHIKRIPNDEVADLFAQSHYFVLPYQDIAQSGAITVAFRYNLPTLVSDLKQFEEFVMNNETGVMFESGNEVDLADKMLYLINNHDKLYISMKKAQSDFVNKELSIDIIVRRYIDYFEKI